MKLDYDITPSTFKYVESLWFNYNGMLKKMKDIERDVVNIPDENSDIKGKGTTSDPTAQELFRKEKVKQNGQYQTLENQVKAIEEVYNSLPPDYKEVARARYFKNKKMDWEQISYHSGYSRRHAMRVRDMIIVATAEKLNLW